MIPRQILLSDAWTTVRTHLTTDLLALRERNDSRLGAEETAFIRGQLEYIKGLLALGNTPTAMQPVSEPGNYDS